jgi:hypothetical protein
MRTKKQRKRPLELVTPNDAVEVAETLDRLERGLRHYRKRLGTLQKRDLSKPEIMAEREKVVHIVGLHQAAVDSLMKAGALIAELSFALENVAYSDPKASPGIDPGLMMA